MNNRISKHTALVCAGVALFAFTSAARARAEFIGSLVTVDVQAGGDTGSWSLNVEPTDDPFTWNLPGPVDIKGQDNETVLATINNLTINLNGDPQAFVFFGVMAGPVPTAFSISSALVAFAPILNPQAVASGQLGVTDLNGNGVTATGSFAGGTKAFEARYNGPTVFADLVTTPVAAGAFGSNSANEAFPLVGTTPIAGLVGNIQVEFNFLLTAGDLASGTGVFTVTPEPSSMALAMMGVTGFVLWARRRRRK
jgi:PEP-CTERM motif